jgi:putative sulfotransferase
MSVPTFIVGTGRCGSTMLSNMLREHPKILSISEFFGYVAEGQTERTFTWEQLDGRSFWKIIAFISPLSHFTSRNRLTIPESLYDRDAPTARYTWETGVPAFLVTTLPHISDDPDRLFGLLESEVRQWSTASISEHYMRLFGWLSTYYEKPLWVERSGTSLLLADQMNATFPEAKFVHIVRDGRDAAISMQQHWGLRIVAGLNAAQQYLGVDPVQSTDRSRLEQVPPELRSLLPESFDVAAFRAFDLPLQTCGKFWRDQVAAGLPTLQSLPAQRLLTLR